MDPELAAVDIWRFGAAGPRHERCVETLPVRVGETSVGGTDLTVAFAED